MPKTNVKLDDFEVLATIGSGTYGTCKKIRRKSDKKVITIESCICIKCLIIHLYINCINHSLLIMNPYIEN